MNEDKFRREAKLAGFSNNQVEFLWKCMAQKPHTHRIDEIDGLEDVIEDLGGEDSVEDGEDNED